MAEAAAVEQTQHDLEKRRGVMLVLSSPSGAGKTTISRNLLETEQNVHLSISVTTRPRRSNEIEGVHYYFLSQKQFDRMRDAGELLEWAEVHGNCYGTPREAVERELAAGRDVLFDIDYQGTMQLYQSMRQDMVTIFILPPSVAEQKQRLTRRAQDDDATIRKRLTTAKTEITHWVEYDYVLINEDLERTFADVQAILRAERLRRPRRPELAGFIADLDRQLDAELAK